MLDRLRSQVASAIHNKVEPLLKAQDELKSQIGRLQAHQLELRKIRSIQDAEFKVFSQWGEDGIIQYLIRKVPIESETFVELGVGDYSESNTRFLLTNDNWRGLIIDQGNAHQEFVRRNELQWKHSLEATRAFITAENITKLIQDAGIQGDIGLLSVDIDGTDFWVLRAIEQVSPRIIIVEYNSVFGPDRTVTVPYDPSFRRFQAHYSGLYWGASLGAFHDLLSDRGFQLVGSNSVGSNAFFVRRDLGADLPDLSPQEAWVESRFRDSRDQTGTLSYVTTHEERWNLISGLPLVDVGS